MIQSFYTDNSPSVIPQMASDKDLVVLSETPINLSSLAEFVRDGEAGAIASFSGTTRNNFTGATTNPRSHARSN